MIDVEGFDESPVNRGHHGSARRSLLECFDYALRVINLSGEGENTRLQISTWLGWISVLPSKPSWRP